MHGLQYLYNLCYRCESGQEILIQKNVFAIIESAHMRHSGDREVMYQCRKLELSLKKDGWRGFVEELMTREMRGETLDSSYLESASLTDLSDRLKERYGEEGSLASITAGSKSHHDHDHDHNHNDDGSKEDSKMNFESFKPT